MSLRFSIFVPSSPPKYPAFYPSLPPL
jgi:hypothetical protein